MWLKIYLAKCPHYENKTKKQHACGKAEQEVEGAVALVHDSTQSGRRRGQVEAEAKNQKTPKILRRARPKA